MRLIKYLLLSALLVFAGAGVMAQEKVTVSGIMKDKNGNPLPGGTIETAKPRTAIATTDSEGRFKVTVNAGTELIFTFTGHADVRQKATATKTVVITMLQKENALQDVVVQGFKQKTRETSTGSSVVISGKQVQDVPVSNVIELLQGKVAGLNVQNNTGSPGAMGTINLRGISSVAVSSDGFLTPTSPLFVIDGVPVDANTNYEYGFQSGGPGISPLALIPPEDIENFDILKDAAATAQYGSRGAYGVILVTTRRGQSKVPIIQYSSNVFVKVPPRLREVIGGKAERRERIDAILKYDTTLAAAQSLINSTWFLSDSLNPFYNNSTNWQDYFYRTTYNQQHNLSIYGGDHRFNYKTNLNYYKENGIVENTGFSRYTMSMNALYQPTDAFRMLVNLSGALGQRENGSGVGLLQTGLASSAAASSLLPPPSMFSENNGALAAASVRNSNKTANVSTSLDLQWEPIKGVRASNLLSYNFNSGTADRFTPAFLNEGASESYSYNDRTYTLYNRTALNYIKTLNDVHNFSAFVFNEINSYGFRASAVQLSQTSSDQIEGPIGYNWERSKGGTLNNIKDTRQHGYGATVSYNYDRKYVVDFSYRFDGLSTNGPNQGYSENPSISARWNFNREKWFDNADWLSYGSIRGSWGRNIKPTGTIFDVYGKYVVGEQYNNNPTVYIDYTNVPNTNFQPETQTQASGAIEMGFWNNKLETTFETYYRSVDNQVMSIPLPNITGFSNFKTNAVSLVNYGVEWSARWRVLPSTRKVQWSLSVNGALNREVLTKLPNGLRQMEASITDNGGNVPIVYRVGRNVFSNLLYHTQGVYASNADVPVNIATGKPQQLNSAASGFYFQGGDPRWTDINGDYVIDANDLIPIGNPIPKVTGGINSLTSYKQWQLNVNVSYTLFRDLLNSASASLFQAYNNPTALNAMLPINNVDFWKPNADGKETGAGSANATYPNPYDFRRAGTLQPFRTNQTLFLEDGSYWKINNVVLSYNVPRAFLMKYRMTSCRLTFTVNNVYTFSNYTGPDPELVTALGRDNSGGYPNARSFAAGVNIQF